MNFIDDMYGPTFPLFYGCVIMVTVAVCWWSVRRRDPTAHLPPLLLPADPDPYEIAYLRGEENEVTRVVMFHLIQSCYLQGDETKDGDLSTGQKLVQIPIAQVPNHPDPRHLSPMEHEVFDWFASPLTASEIFQSSSLLDRVKQHCAVYEKRLQSKLLLCPSEMKDAARRIGVNGGLLILALGGYNLLAALAKGHSNVGVLFLMMGIMMGITLPFLTAICYPPRLSCRGQDYLKRLQKAFKRLRPKATAATPGLPDPTLRLLVALFGVGLLVGTSYAYFEQMFHRATASGGGYGGGCGGGCGGCGGCGG